MSTSARLSLSLCVYTRARARAQVTLPCSGTTRSQRPAVRLRAAWVSPSTRIHTRPRPREPLPKVQPSRSTRACPVARVDTRRQIHVPREEELCDNCAAAALRGRAGGIWPLSRLLQPKGFTMSHSRMRPVGARRLCPSLDSPAGTRLGSAGSQGPEHVPLPSVHEDCQGPGSLASVPPRDS